MEQHQQQDQEVAPAYRDPVCGMSVSAASAHQTTHDGVNYYFCSARCLGRFKAVPETFLAPGSHPLEPEPSGNGPYICPMCPEIEQATPGSCPKCGMALERELDLSPHGRTSFTCPMHPEIVQDELGDCPICGMALEPSTVTLEEDENPELADMTRRFRVSVMLTLPLVFIAMGELIPGVYLDWLGSPEVQAWIQLLLAAPVVLWGGAPFFLRGWRSLVSRHLNMFHPDCPRHRRGVHL